MLEKKNARLEAELEHEREELGRAMVEIGKMRESLERVEAESELKDEAIVELQTAFDNKDRPSASGEVNEGQDLQQEIRRLEAKVAEKTQQVNDCVKANWNSILPALDQRARNESRNWQAKCQKLQKVLVDTKAELTEVGTLKDALQVAVRTLLAEIENDARVRAANEERLISAGESFQAMESHMIIVRSALEQVQSETGSSQTKMVRSARKVGEQFGPILDKPAIPEKRQKVSGATYRFDFGMSADGAKAQSKPGAQAQTSQQAKPSPIAPLTGRLALEGTVKPQGTDDHGFIEVPRGKSAPTKQGPKEGSFAQQAASKNSFDLLSETDRQSEKRDKKVSPPSIDPAAKTYKWSKHSEKSVAQNSPSLGMFGIKFEPEDEFSPKPVMPPKFNPAVAPFTPTPEKSMAQVAADPPVRQVSSTEEFMLEYIRVKKEEELAAKAKSKSKVPAKKRMEDAALGKVVGPGTPKPRQ